MTAGEIPSGSGTKSTETPDVDDPLYNYHVDIVTGTIISFKLLGTENFIIWKCSMTRAVKAKKQLGFVDETVTKIDNYPVKSLTRERKNTIMCSWILGSISETIYIGHACSEKGC